MAYSLQFYYLTWWNFLLTLRCFSISFLVSTFKSLPSIIWASNAEQYWLRPRSLIHMRDTQRWSTEDISENFLKNNQDHTLRSQESRNWSLNTEALHYLTNFPCQPNTKCLENSMKNVHTDPRIKCLCQSPLLRGKKKSACKEEMIQKHLHRRGLPVILNS